MSNNVKHHLTLISLKTLNSSVFVTKFDMMCVLLHFEVFKEQGNDIRYK